MRRIAVALCCALLAVMGAPSAAEPESVDPEHKFDLAKRYYGECHATSEDQFDAIRPHLKAFTDVEVMADTMADPARFSQLMRVVMDPRTVHVMSKCASEPVMWDTWMRGITDWQKMSRAMTRFMNPNMYMQWMMAPMQPAMWQPMTAMWDPNFYGRWMTAMMNPAFYQPAFAMMDPNWYAPRIQWLTTPHPGPGHPHPGPGHP
jgi:hypothetical protein